MNNLEDDGDKILDFENFLVRISIIEYTVDMNLGNNKLFQEEYIL